MSRKLLSRQECGCEYWQEEFVDNAADITWKMCPLHDAAGDLLKACEFLYGECLKWGCDSGCDIENTTFNDREQYDKAKTTIVKATKVE